MLRSLQAVPRCLGAVWAQLQAASSQSACFQAIEDTQTSPHMMGQYGPANAAALQHVQPFSSSSSTSMRTSSTCAGGSSNSSSSWAAGFGRCTGHSRQSICSHYRVLPHICQPAAAGLFRHKSSDSARQETIQRRSEMHQRKMLQFEFKTVTLGTVMDPYKRPVSLFQAGVLPHPTKTANFIMNQIRSRIQSEGAGLEARSKIPGYKKKLLVQQVADMYKQINEAQANYQLEKVKDLVDDRLFTRMRAQAEERRMGRWDKMFFQLVEDENKPLADNITLVRGRVFRSDKESPVTWIQFTFRIRSQQRFAAYSLSSQPGSPGKQATLVYGNPDELLDVEDYWVFEYKAKEPQNKTQQTWPGARWRLVGRLNV